MAISDNRISMYDQPSNSNDQERPRSGDGVKKDLWSSMLDSVASGKRLPEKNILVLGGSSDSQKEYLEALSVDAIAKGGLNRHGSRQPPLANNFALGYTYYDVPDTDHEGFIHFLARVSLYLLADPSPSFTPLLKPLLTPQTIPNTLIVVLLDWSHPWLWLSQLRDWIKLLRNLLVSLDQKCKTKMEQVMVNWRDRGRGSASLDGGGNNVAADGDISLPLGPGEWEEALGLPLCVVCQNSDQMEKLEREQGWREEEFDFVLQFLRTVLLKHGASLIYTIPSVPSPLQTLIHSSLGIHSLLKKQSLKHNVIDRDKVLLPPNWDSWGKIRVLREGFDVEGVSRGWSTDIEERLESLAETHTDSNNEQVPGYSQMTKEVDGAVAMFEEHIQNPTIELLSNRGIWPEALMIDIDCLDNQEFLSNQLEVLANIRSGMDSSSIDSKRDAFGPKSYQSRIDISETNNYIEEGRVNEHIGPVQFNMGGIQVDADDMLQKLKDRQGNQTPSPETPGTGNEALASFFARLIKRDGDSTSNSPKSGT